MNLENVLEIIKPRPSFWLRVWIFFFLLINRKEGKRLIKTLTEKIDECVQKNDEVVRKVDAYSKEVDEYVQKNDERYKAAAGVC
ncbi:MAG: hypothetical protein LBK02_04150 [Treponema sp.]|jgi:hypothetical protein|nr:hypothetical protein [Treponema sp.]